MLETRDVGNAWLDHGSWIVVWAIEVKHEAVTTLRRTLFLQSTARTVTQFWHSGDWESWAGTVL